MSSIANLLRRARLGFSVIVIALFLSSSTSLAQPDGEKIFKSTCKTCHSPTSKKGTGPGLKGFWDRLPGADDDAKSAWLIKWVKDPVGVLASGDAYALSVKADFSTVMTGQPHLSDEEILAVAEYVKSYVAPMADGAGADECYDFDAQEAGVDVGAVWWTITMIAVFLVLIITLATVRKSLLNLRNERKGRDPEPEYGLLEGCLDWIGRHKLQGFLMFVLLILFGSVKGWYALKEVGVYQGYAPVQPIKFSHKIHAGDNAINCVYCHTSAEKGKTAGIPSVNVCMNCHKGIDEGSCTKKEEIAKIYEAAGWNPEEQKYDKPQKPIEWIRIHNLPDFVYFNHSQHVMVGNQKCQTCHGPVEEMDVVEQHSMLTMGWCIDCHKETQVAMVGNPYYDKMYAELVEKHKGRGANMYTVEDIGGIECGKCHY